VSESDSDEGDPKWNASVEDLIAVIRGTATPDQTEMVRNALEDPGSSLSEVCHQIERWAKDRFQIPNPPAAQRLSPRNKAKERLDAVLEFVRLKRIGGILSDNQVAALISPGPGAPEIHAPPLTPVECNAIATRVLKSLEKNHPELCPELQQFRSDHRR